MIPIEFVKRNIIWLLQEEAPNARFLPNNNNNIKLFPEKAVEVQVVDVL